MVEVLNFFQFVEDPLLVPILTPRVSCSLSEVSVSEEEVYEQLSLLNPNKAPGPDGIHPCLLKNCANTVTRPLFMIFAHSLEMGCIPEEWKKANIIPIFKKGH